MARDDVELPAKPLYFAKGESMVGFLVRSFPVVSFPEGLSHFAVPNTAHEILANGVECAYGMVPHLKSHIVRRHQVKRLVVAVQNIDDSDPSVLVLYR